MSITPNDFLESAKELLHKQDATEVDFRNSISRAYYAAFHTVISFLPEPPDGHRPLIRYIKEGRDIGLSTKDRNKLAMLLSQLRVSRETSDYHLNIGIYNTSAGSCIRTAIDIATIINANTDSK